MSRREAPSGESRKATKHNAHASCHDRIHAGGYLPKIRLVSIEQTQNDAGAFDQRHRPFILYGACQ